MLRFAASIRSSLATFFEGAFFIALAFRSAALCLRSRQLAVSTSRPWLSRLHMTSGWKEPGSLAPSFCWPCSALYFFSSSEQSWSKDDASASSAWISEAFFLGSYLA